MQNQESQKCYVEGSVLPQWQQEARQLASSRLPLSLQVSQMAVQQMNVQTLRTTFLQVPFQCQQPLHFTKQGSHSAELHHIPSQRAPPIIIANWQRHQALVIFFQSGNISYNLYCRFLNKNVVEQKESVQTLRIQLTKE